MYRIQWQNGINMSSCRMQNQVVCTLMHCCPQLFENTGDTWNVHCKLPLPCKTLFITCSDDKQCLYKLMFENNLKLWWCYQTTLIRHIPVTFVGNLFEINWHHQLYGIWINMNLIGVQMIFFSAQRSRWYAQGSSPKWRSLLIYPMVGCMLWSHPRNPWIVITSSLMREVWHIQHCYT